MSKKKVITIAVSVVLVAAVATLIVTNVAGGKKEEVVAEVPPVVAAENPELRSIEVSTELIGTIEPDSIVYVTPKGAGEIISVNVQTGDQVTAGQLLCEIDTKQVEAARLTMETARVSYEDAKSNLDRYSVGMGSSIFKRMYECIRHTRFFRGGFAYHYNFSDSGSNHPLV